MCNLQRPIIFFSFVTELSLPSRGRFRHAWCAIGRVYQIVHKAILFVR